MCLLRVASTDQTILHKGNLDTSPTALGADQTKLFYIVVTTTTLYTNLMKQIERMQTGLRLEKRLVKVLKGLAEYLDMPMSELVEGIALHAFEGKPPFGPDTIARIEQLKAVYDMDLTAQDSHKLREKDQ